MDGKSKMVLRFNSYEPEKIEVISTEPKKLPCMARWGLRRLVLFQ